MGSYSIGAAHDPSAPSGHLPALRAGRNSSCYSAGFATTPPCPCIADASSSRGETLANL